MTPLIEQTRQRLAESIAALTQALHAIESLTGFAPPQLPQRMLAAPTAQDAAPAPEPARPARLGRPPRPPARNGRATVDGRGRVGLMVEAVAATLPEPFTAARLHETTLAKHPELKSRLVNGYVCGVLNRWHTQGRVTREGTGRPILYRRSKRWDAAAAITPPSPKELAYRQLRAEMPQPKAETDEGE